MKEMENGEGFKFAISAITALLTFSYIIYNYFQNTANSINLHFFAISIINFSIITSLFLFTYILIKGFSLEIQDINLKNRLTRFASNIYIFSFFMSSIILFQMLTFFYLFITDSYNSDILYSIFIIFYLVVIYLYYWINTKNQLQIQRGLGFYPKNSKQKKIPKILLPLVTRIGLKLNPLKIRLNTFSQKNQEKHPKIYSIGRFFIQKNYSIKKFLIQHLNEHAFIKSYYFYLFSILIILFSLFPLVLITIFMQGNIIVDMDNVYYKNDTQIPVLITVTGPDTGLSAHFFKEYNNNFTLIAQIPIFEPQSNSIILSNGSIIGNTLDSGRYCIFINTTNLSTGYYKLIFSRPKTDETHSTSFFFIDENN